MSAPAHTPPDKSIPLQHPYMQVLKQYQDDFGGANTVLVALIQKDGDIKNPYFGSKMLKCGTVQKKGS